MTPSAEVSGGGGGDDDDDDDADDDDDDDDDLVVMMLLVRLRMLIISVLECSVGICVLECGDLCCRVRKLLRLFAAHWLVNGDASSELCNCVQ